MDSLPIEVIVVLVGAGVVVLAWLLLRFGKVIGRWTLILGSIAIVMVFALAVLENSRATSRTAQAVQVATIGQTTTSTVAMLCIGGLGAVALAALGVAGYFYARWRLMKRRVEQLPRQRRRTLPDHKQPVMYVDNSDSFDLAGVDLSQWGW